MLKCNFSSDDLTVAAPLFHHCWDFDSNLGFELFPSSEPSGLKNLLSEEVAIQVPLSWRLASRRSYWGGSAALVTFRLFRSERSFPLI
jgi:hypothetical protein